MNEPRALTNLRDLIRNEIISIIVEMLDKGIRNFGKRL